jgi:thiamine biosynthesis lipoprotein
MQSPSGVEITVSRTFAAIGTTNTVITTDPATIVDATTIAQEHLRELDLAVSRFRPDSEVSRLAAAARNGPASTLASPVLAAYLRGALHAAQLTDGLVDPTVGSAVVASGYDADMADVRSRKSIEATAAAPVPGWHRVSIDENDVVTVPAGALVDLGSTAKAQAADTIAGLLPERLPGGFLVNLGGDIAVSGACPAGGWRIGIEDEHGDIMETITTTGQAVATSSTRKRTWATTDGVRHHIVDPRTGATARAVWAHVTCAAATALEANAATTAAVVLGHQAPAWLAAHGIPGRLQGTDGTVHYVAGWPEPEPERELTPTAEPAASPAEPTAFQEIS